MTTKETFKAILDSLPPKSSRSRLEPYAELIMELHRRGRTYREITRILSERCDVRTSRSTVNDFVRVRSKRVRNLQKRGLPDPKTRSQDSASSSKTNLHSEAGVATDEIQKRIADIKSRPVQDQMSTQLFHYDPCKPLHIPHNKMNRGEE
jgi:hypothetical protein